MGKDPGGFNKMSPEHQIRVLFKCWQELNRKSFRKGWLQSNTGGQTGFSFRKKKKCKFILVAAPNIIIISGCGPGLLLPFFLGNKEKTQT